MANSSFGARIPGPDNPGGCMSKTKVPRSEADRSDRRTNITYIGPSLGTDWELLEKFEKTAVLPTNRSTAVSENRVGARA